LVYIHIAIWCTVHTSNRMHCGVSTAVLFGEHTTKL
jgi:hypothetical protein